MKKYDESIEYETLLLSVKKKLSDISNIGVDCSTFSTIVAEMEKEDNESYTTVKSINYFEKIAKLQEIAEKLNEFNQQYIIYYKALSIEKFLDNREKNNIQEDLSSSKINELVELIKSAIETLLQFKINYDFEKNIADKVYRVSYRVMKTELKYTSTSKLIEYFKNNAAVRNYINMFIEEDIASLNLEDNLYNYILEVINKIKSFGIDYSYLDELLLLCLSLDENDIAKINREYSQIQEKCTTQMNDYDELTEKLTQAIKVKNKKRKNLNAQRTKTLIISLITIASLYGSYKLGGLIGKTNTYYTTTESYSSIISESKFEDEYLPVLEEQSTTTLTKYGTFEKDGRKYVRKIKTYDLSHIELDKASDYASLDLESLGIKPKEKKEKKDSLVPEDLYTDDYYEIVKIVQDMEQIIVDTSESRKYGIAITCIIALIIFFIDCIIEALPISQTIELISFKKKYKTEKSNVKSIKLKLLELKKELESNEKLRNQMKEKYQKLLCEENSKLKK